MNADTLWSLANAIACAARAYFTGFPRAQPGRMAIARTLVATMAAAISVSILVHRYAAPFEVVLNFAFAFAACVQRGDILGDAGRSPGDAAPSQSES
ncbi:hypothetical protein [Paraburkholderia adhaesiva]|uniref:hypothetical protein n=1 Tax=Paraburkholderia adhaesiva TaxID=2883244 RepID=UPI001F314343|nr:hypothetical protein [Paraburkholderia adhaesiva]